MRRYYLVMGYLLLIYSFHGDCQRRNQEREGGAHWNYDIGWPSKMYRLMAEHYEDVSRKIEFIREIRFSYEESPQYEMGYIMGEIIERYRKMVEQLKRPIMFHSDAVFVTIKRVGFIQMLYFEIYHLVNMMHEIPKKYGLSDDLSKQIMEIATDKVPFDNNKKALEAQEKLIRDKEERARNKKQKLKEMKKLRELMLKGQYHTEKTRKPQNKWWPIDYGWEIDYYW